MLLVIANSSIEFEPEHFSDCRVTRSYKFHGRERHVAFHAVLIAGVFTLFQSLLVV